MRFSIFTTASIAAALAAAQTHTECNPTQQECPNNPAMTQNWQTDFTSGAGAVRGWNQTVGSLSYTSDGAQFAVAKKGDAPTIVSEAYLLFGYVEVVMKAAPGQGIISSFFLQSDDLDEVDWEWIGGVDSKVQTNYFGKGNTTTYDRMIQYDAANNQNEFHTYALNWTAEALTWFIDGKPVRTLKYDEAVGGKNYPQTPCNIRVGNWAGGDSESEGTRQWAGGAVDYQKAPFLMTVKSIKVINYNPSTEYQWTDKSGSYTSIKSIGAGNSNGAPQNSAVMEAPASASKVSARTTGSYSTGSPEASQTSDQGSESPCGESVITVTMTGTSPINSVATTAINGTGAAPSYSVSRMTTQASSAQGTMTASLGYATTGIAVDTRPVPSVPNPYTFSTGSLPRPSGSSNISAPPAQFTAAAAQNQAGILAGALAGALLLAI